MFHQKRQNFKNSYIELRMSKFDNENTITKLITADFVFHICMLRLAAGGDKNCSNNFSQGDIRPLNYWLNIYFYPYYPFPSFLPSTTLRIIKKEMVRPSMVLSSHKLALLQRGIYDQVQSKEKLVLARCS